ncbi:hypothetical protein [Pseudofrankia sp. DC12]|uniref:hypothetical protein n=1 Tax=Pseudofrankia sp. DC12 TaxID=683315 RepID=UPI0005F86896|nr:hypothetical protein [Pseudofrankia sp. DC12]
MKLAVNASPSTVATALADLVRGVPHRDRLIIEITEHENHTAGPGTLRAVSHLREPPDADTAITRVPGRSRGRSSLLASSATARPPAARSRAATTPPA